MPKTAKIVAGFLIGMVVLLVLFVGVVYAVGGRWMDETYHADVAAVTVPSDSASVAWGKHLAEAVAACTSCHGEDLGGRVMVESPVFANWYPANLTRGEGGIGGTYTAADWVRAIRHGIAPDGRGLIMMPASGTYHLSDDDIGALIAYARSVPPVDRTFPPSTLNAIGRVAMVMGGAPFLLAHSIDHDAPRMPKPELSDAVAYGDYLARVCSACHGADMEGDIGPDLRPHAGYAHVDAATFMTIMRTGVSSKGRAMDPEHMPWPNFARMTDVELGAIWAYLKTLPAGG